jgi:hypothetical protein
MLSHSGAGTGKGLLKSREIGILEKWTHVIVRASKQDCEALAVAALMPGGRVFVCGGVAA